MNIWIAAEFEWKMQRIEHFDDTVNIDSIDEIRKHPAPHLISQFEIEITLTKKCMPTGIELNYKVNESLLFDDAFRPQIYTVKLEKGNFLCPYDAMFSKEDKFTPRFALRLIFDKSPYPPRREWRQPQGAPDAVKMWEWKEFYGRKSAELKKLANRDPWWGKCVVS